MLTHIILNLACICVVGVIYSTLDIGGGRGGGGLALKSLRWIRTRDTFVKEIYYGILWYIM